MSLVVTRVFGGHLRNWLCQVMRSRRLKKDACITSSPLNVVR